MLQKKNPPTTHTHTHAHKSRLLVDMVIDILSDRGFSVGHAHECIDRPVRVNLATGDIETASQDVHKFR